MAAVVDSRLVTLAAPLHAPSAGGPRAFYSHLHEELARILATCGDHTTAATSSVQAAHADVMVPGHEVTSPATDAGAAAIADSARQLDTEVDRLWRLDTSILRTADTVGMLDAPPMLAPGPHVTGAGSAAVRLKQLQAAFVARSQQVNMAHNRYKCLSKHNDLYKTYVRVSTDSIGPPLGSPRSTVSPPPGGYSSHTSSASEAEIVTHSSLNGFSSTGAHAGAVNGLATSSAGSAVHFGLAAVSRASSFGGSEMAEMACHHAASFGQQPASRHASPPPHAVSESCFATASVSSRGGAAPMDVDSVPPCSSACSSGSPPASPTSGGGRSATDAEVPTSRDSSPPLRAARRGFLGLGAFFSRRQPPEPPQSPPKPPVLQQAPPTIHEEDAAVPEVRRSFSEPSVVGRRGALELSRESLDDLCVHRGFAMAGDEPGPLQPRRSRDTKRSSETLRSKSEPASMTRDSRRRRNFFLEDAEDYPEPGDAFSNPDLDSRVQIFSSEAQLHRSEDPDMYEYSRRRTCRV